MALKTFKPYTKSTRGTILTSREGLWKGKPFKSRWRKIKGTVFRLAKFRNTIAHRNNKVLLLHHLLNFDPLPNLHE